MSQLLNIPFTLEMHLNEFSSYDIAYKELVSMYYLLRKRLTERLLNTRSVFVEYSLHDASHSKTIIQSIERFLGEERIRKLSITDTFMILVCAYAHDYGMAKSYDKIYEILGSKQFKDFLDNKEQNRAGLDEDDIESIRDLKDHMEGKKKANIPLNRLYRSIMHAIQLYLRPNHPEGVYSIKKDFDELFKEILKDRFISGGEGIVEICMCHGKDFKSIFELSKHADGIVGDDFHPRFIAAMIRLGDLLDLDNGRFPEWFIKETQKPESVISELSKIHARKHQAITHLLITDEEITITAHCESESSGNETAILISEWTNSLKEECENLVLNWSKIAQPDFGLPPGNVEIKILLDKKEYLTVNRFFQMQMSQEKAMDLLKGTSIYQNQYVGIRELLQNAVDASLLQLWVDLKQNRYKSIGISKNTVLNKKLKLSEFSKIPGANAIFGNYDITLELIKNTDKKRVEIVIKDKGIGISKDDIKYIADIGSSEKNTNRKKLVEEMPDWLKPSGIFGIGLQSVFQITEAIEFYTRQHNIPERKITLNSYGRSRGRIEVSEVAPNKDGLYNDNSIPGTNAKIIVDRNKFSFGSESDTDSKLLQLLYYDEDFDNGDDLEILYAELSQACKEIVREVKRDYFNVHVEELTIIKENVPVEEGGTIPGRKYKNYRNSYFYFSKNVETDIFGFSASPLFISKGQVLHFTSTKAYYWDDKKNRAYRLEVRPCNIKERDSYRQVHVPQKRPDLYRVSYKFNKISQSDTIYSHKDLMQISHAGFLIWNIQILDYPPTKYLNIDRDRLRTDAINEEELFETRNIILEEWCLEFINNTKKGDFLSSRVEYLLSFIILFYQNINTELFIRFIDKYGKLVSDDLYIGDKEIPIKRIWEKNSIFYSNHKITDKYEGIEAEKEYFPEDTDDATDKSKTTDVTGNTEASSGDQESDAVTKSTLTAPDIQNNDESTEVPAEESASNEDTNDSENEESTNQEEPITDINAGFAGGDGSGIMMETVRHFPHRIVHPNKIVQYNEGTVMYYFTFGVVNNTDYKIAMDDYSRAVDYTLSMQNEDVIRKGFPVANIQKKVFKPDKQYQHLIVSKYPHTFKKGANFSTFLDECLRSYILSPFGGDDLDWHTREIIKALDIVIKGPENSIIITEFVNRVKKTKKYQQCVEYVYKYSVYRRDDLSDEDYLKLINEEYGKFVEEFCRIMIQYHTQMLDVQQYYAKKTNKKFIE